MHKRQTKKAKPDRRQRTREGERDSTTERERERMGERERERWGGVEWRRPECCVKVLAAWGAQQSLHQMVAVGIVAPGSGNSNRLKRRELSGIYSRRWAQPEPVIALHYLILI